MGLRDRFQFTARVAGGTITPTTQIASPWSNRSHLSTIAIADLFGVEAKVATRADAMRVPAIVKARSLIAGTLCRYPLAKYDHDVRVDADPWMYRTSTGQSPQQRMLWTIDDLIFNGTSLWAVDRDDAGAIQDAVRVLPEDWELDADLRIKVHGEVVSADEVVLIEGPQDGLLEIGASDIVASHSMRRAWQQRVDAPVPLVELHDTEDIPMEDDEITEVVEAWETARKNGGTAYTPSRIETKIHGDTPTDLFVEGRNAARLDWANFLNLPGSILDGSTATASLTYTTQEGSRGEFVDYCLSYWATAIEARLSMDDVVEAGTRVAFDLSWLTTPQPGPGPVRED